MIKPSEITDTKKKSGTNVKYEVITSLRLGRHLVAGKDLTAGETILQEHPVVVGPVSLNQVFLCFNCMKPLDSEKIKYTCSKCNVVPLCQPACQIDQGSHDTIECRFFDTNASHDKLKIVNNAGLLLPLRLWLLKDHRPELWKKVTKLEDHAKERRGTSVWAEREETVVQVLMKMGLVPNDLETANLLQRLCGILDVNSFELRAVDNSKKHLLRGIFIEAALISHDCRGNTHLTLDDERRLTVIASVPIRAGETIYYNYTGPFLGTAERRHCLRVGKYFECRCSLCEDPSELGSHLSSLLCPRCRRGYLGIQQPSTIEHYALGTKWQCGSCESVLSGRLVRTTLNLIRSLIDGAEHLDAKALETLLRKLMRTLHANHYLTLEVKQKLLVAYRTELSSLDPRKKILQRVIELCKEILEVLTITMPGISRLKAITMYEMHLPMVMLAKREYVAREISQKELVTRLDEVQCLLRKALPALLLETPTSSEGQLAKRGLTDLKFLMQDIADVSALPSDDPKRGFKEKNNRKHKTHREK